MANAGLLFAQGLPPVTETTLGPGRRVTTTTREDIDGNGQYDTTTTTVDRDGDGVVDIETFQQVLPGKCVFRTTETNGRVRKDTETFETKDPATGKVTSTDETTTIRTFYDTGGVHIRHEIRKRDGKVIEDKTTIFDREGTPIHEVGPGEGGNGGGGGT